MRTVEQILEDHQARMLEIRNADRQATKQLGELNVLLIHNYGVPHVANELRELKLALIKSVIGAMT